MNAQVPDLAQALNVGCPCKTLEPTLLEPGWLVQRPTLFSSSPVFITKSQRRAIGAAVQALERAIGLPAFRQEALARAGLDGGALPAACGVFMGYDFHLTEAGPRLIEINTNAGGALLHAAVVRAHRGCCSPVDRMLGLAPEADDFERQVLAMFRAEWQASRGEIPLRTVAIVDEAPASQYLVLEFELARRLFAAEGLGAVVCDPAELSWREGRLWHPALPDGLPVDLVYNRLTDFRLEEPGHAALRQAHQEDAVVLTPHPAAHALHADKRNLVALSNPARLREWGLPEADGEVLSAVVPRTSEVTPGDADELWSGRRKLFFKPVCGFGSRGAYRGDKLTRRVWAEVVAGGYVAQDLVAPGERVVEVDGERQRLKVDLRAYTYRGRILLLAARTYDGQTTNFRTPGGGFAPIVVLPGGDA
jgi:hypothetical protein